MPVDDVAVRGFGSAAEAYEHARPAYADDAVALLVDALAPRPGSRIVDLAAGTGKLTRQVLAAGAGVIAVEPVEGMRRVLHAMLPQVPTVAGIAEALPFAPASVDAVTIAQAFHWFDADLAWAELARVVRRGGRVGIVYNTRDRSVPWVDALWGIVDRVEHDERWQSHGSWLDRDEPAPDGFGAISRAVFPYSQTLDADGVVQRIAGVSHVASLADDERAAVLDEVRALVGEQQGEQFAIPYRCDVWWCERT